MSAIGTNLIRISRQLLLGEHNGLRCSIQGKDFVFQKEGVKFSNVELDVVGDNNQLIIGPGSELWNVYFRLRGSDQRIEFGENCRISRGGKLWFEDDNCSLVVGSNTTMVEVHIAVTENGSMVTIGEDCMFANDIDLRTGDSHSVIDVNTGERLNFPGNIHIGRHVWIAPHTVILKGVSLGENTIVATGSVVTKSFEAGVIIGGNPARIIKTGVSWTRDRISKTT
jgi:acetyltransferase-like isoleucine patch superfamily enzyme